MYSEKYVHTLNIIDSSNLSGHARNGHGLIMKSVYGTIRNVIDGWRRFDVEEIRHEDVLPVDRITGHRRGNTCNWIIIVDSVKMSRFPSRTRQKLSRWCSIIVRISRSISWKFSSFLAHFVIFILYITRSLVNEISPLKKKKRERERILKRFRKFGEKKICSEINL